MAKIFDIQDWLKNNPNRNNFDLTHKVHGSYKFGYWYPFLCKPVVPTDSFHIETAVSTRFMPMPFPTQSNMRLIFHYHFVRMKNIWPNFENWIMGLEEHTPPYLNLPHTYFKDGSLADYLGVQTSFHVGVSELNRNDFLFFDRGKLETSQGFTSLDSCFCTISKQVVGEYTNDSFVGFIQRYGTFAQMKDFADRESSDLYQVCYIADGVVGEKLNSTYQIGNVHIDTTNYPAPVNEDIWIGVRSKSNPTRSRVLPFKYSIASNRVMTLELDSSLMTPFELNDPFIEKVLTIPSDWIPDPQFVVLYPVNPSAKPTPVNTFYPLPFVASKFAWKSFVSARSVEIGSNDVSKCPYYCSDTANGDTNVVKVSSLPFRAYESICRAYYQNTQGVQPFVVNGVTKYNQWNTTTDDGADSTNYELFKRNWELDAYTSCLLTPQQLPVFVGLTNVSSLGNMRLETPDGQEASVRLADGDNPQSVEYSNLQAETPEARRYALNVASLGFTIPEFREANSLQRWLEMNIRKGYRYKDFIEGHFGKAPKYSELDMPEFLGGFTQKVSVNDISNTNGGTDPTDISGTLGAIAGQARAIGGSKHGVNHYFDDYGFVVGVFCIVPDVAYDCLLPKHFNLTSPLSLYFPEFSQTSFQEVPYSEFCPAQRKNDGGSLASSFGYQRPNHDLVWYPDTVHGRFRDASGIGNSVVCRRFASAPQLSSDFLAIDSQSADTIFSYTLGDEDICLGEIVIGISAKRPIPRLFNPSIS